MDNGVIELRVKEFSIEEFIDDLEFGILEKGIESFKITEEFDIFGKREYVVEDLEMEIDNEYITCTDRNCVLRKNVCVMMQFLKECVTKITKVIVNGIAHAIIEFTDGKVLLEIEGYY